MFKILSLSHFETQGGAGRTGPARLRDDRLVDRSSFICPRLLAGLLRWLEPTVLALLGAVAIVRADAGQLASDPTSWLLVALMVLFAVAITDLLGLYDRQSLLDMPAPAMLRMQLALTLAFCALPVCLTLLGPGVDLDLRWLASWFLTSSALLTGGRAGLGLLADRWRQNGALSRRAVIYGAGTSCAELIHKLEASTDGEVRIVGIFDDRAADRVGADVLGYPRVGTLPELIALARTSRIDTIIVALPLSAERRLRDILERLSALPVDIRQPADALGRQTAHAGCTMLCGQPMLALRSKPISPAGLLAKAILDRMLAGLALLALLPVFAAVAAAIKLESRGPVFFRQKRYGFNNQLIEVVKFRSMHVADTDAAAERLVTRGDNRVTRVGRYIRRTSLDELPQLINVLRGDLSLVGPRPHALAAKAGLRIYPEVVDSYFARHRVKPGITGWAQINGWRGETDTEEKLRQRVAHDLYYIENWSLLLDLKILARTPLTLLNSENAY